MFSSKNGVDQFNIKFRFEFRTLTQLFRQNIFSILPLNIQNGKKTEEKEVKETNRYFSNMAELLAYVVKLQQQQQLL